VEFKALLLLSPWPTTAKWHWTYEPPPCSRAQGHLPIPRRGTHRAGTPRLIRLRDNLSMNVATAETAQADPKLPVLQAFQVPDGFFICVISARRASTICLARRTASTFLPEAISALAVSMLAVSRPTID